MKQRIDQLLVARGLCESREKAKRAIMAGQALINCQPAKKPSDLVKPDDQQFLPDPASVIKAAREQLGLEIKPASRTLQVVEVTSVK